MSGSAKQIRIHFARAAHSARDFRVSDAGATAIEYTLIAAGIALAIAAAVVLLGSNLGVSYTKLTTLF